MDRYDIAIIGTGPAGLEAAITAKVRNKRILIVGSSNFSEKVSKAHTIENYLGLPNVSGEEMKKAFQKHLTDMKIEITEDYINTVYAMGDYFALQGHGDMYEASTVILACGMSVATPFAGELDNLGKGVSYCATCDAALYKGKSAIVIGYSKKDENEAAFLAEIADKVYYLPMYQDSINFDGKVEVIFDKKPLSVEKYNQMIRLETDNGYLDADGLFILREYVAPSQLVPGLSIEKNKVNVDRNMRTNIAGLFACGDITGAPYQYIKAAGEGNVAALEAVKYLVEKK